jgi:hypothetical protein
MASLGIALPGLNPFGTDGVGHPLIGNEAGVGGEVGMGYRECIVQFR